MVRVTTEMTKRTSFERIQDIHLVNITLAHMKRAMYFMFPELPRYYMEGFFYEVAYQMGHEYQEIRADRETKLEFIQGRLAAHRWLRKEVFLAKQ